MTSDDSGELRIGEALQVHCSALVPRAPVPLGQARVGDLPNHALRESELAALWRPRVGIEDQQFPAHQRIELRLERLLGLGSKRAESIDGEALAHDRRILEERAFLRRQGVQSGIDERVQRGWHLDAVELARASGAALV